MLHLSLKIAIVAIFIAVSSGAAASPEARRAANLLVIAETLLASSTMIGERNDMEIEKFDWSADFSDRNWSSSIFGFSNDREISIDISGFAWGSPEEDISVNYYGSGTFGDERIIMHGDNVLSFNQEIEDYDAMEFRQISRFGDNSIWTWVYGSELVVGAAGGFIIGGGATVAGSGGFAAGMAPWVAGKAALEGAAVLATISQAVREIVDSEEVPEPPSMPERPQLPENQREIPYDDSHIVVAISKDGNISGRSFDGTHVIEGTFTEDGSASGTIYGSK